MIGADAAARVAPRSPSSPPRARPGNCSLPPVIASA
jgi:hypothetical protein